MCKMTGAQPQKLHVYFRHFSNQKVPVHTNSVCVFGGVVYCITPVFLRYTRQSLLFLLELTLTATWISRHFNINDQLVC